MGPPNEQNPNQGAFVIDELTELVEEAVLRSSRRSLSERGGVLGAMETGYQRSKIRDESLHYEHLKHAGTLPIIGVNTFRNPSTKPCPGASNSPAPPGREAKPTPPPRRLPPATRRQQPRRARRCNAPSSGRQCVRRADGRRPRLLPRADHAGAV